MVVSQAIQVVLFTAVIFAFFLALGTIAVPDDVAVVWSQETTCPDGTQPPCAGTWFGIKTPLPQTLVQTSLFVAVLSGLYFTVNSSVDPQYRQRFFEPLIDDLAVSLAGRDVYRSLDRATASTRLNGDAVGTTLVILNPDRSSSVRYCAAVRSRPFTPSSISRSAHLPMKSRSCSGMTSSTSKILASASIAARTLRKIAAASSSGQSWTMCLRTYSVGAGRRRCRRMIPPSTRTRSETPSLRNRSGAAATTSGMS